MDKKLPKVFVNEINKKLDNNERVFYSKEDREEPSENINQKLNTIFNSSKYVYKANVEIKLKTGTIKKQIVGRNGNYLITIENELIPITDIIDIKYL